MLKKIAIATLLSVTCLSATACNTVRGVGDDLKSVANEVDKEI